MTGMFGEGHTRFSFIEYQTLMVCLALCIGVGLLMLEYGMRRFLVLPTIFPGMFSVRERRLYFFDFEIKDAVIAERCRTQAKILLRMTLCVVMSYLWQRCVLETQQQVGIEFPEGLCDAKMDCFASELHIETLLTRQYQALDCNGTKARFKKATVVSCIKFVTPAATEWLMHVAIAHAVFQLNIKCYEVFSQVCGNSRWARYTILLLLLGSFGTLLTLFFCGVMAEFVSSWLSFVMTLSIPIFLWTVWKTSKIFKELSLISAREMQKNLEDRFNLALASMPANDLDIPQQDYPRTKRSRLASARKVLEAGLAGLPKNIRLPHLRPGSGVSKDGATPSASPSGSPTSGWTPAVFGGRTSYKDDGKTAAKDAAKDVVETGTVKDPISPTGEEAI